MRVGQGTYSGCPLPIVPAPQRDELISSWLQRTAAFYEMPIQLLLRDHARAAKPVNLCVADLGRSRWVIETIGNLLGIAPEHVARQGLKWAYPWAAPALALREPPRELRYAACPVCQEGQRLRHGVAWLCRSWVFAARTICPVHVVPLIPARPGETAHPVWSNFLGKYGGVSAATYRGTGEQERPHSVQAALYRRPESAIWRLYRELANLQSVLLLMAADQHPSETKALRTRAIKVRDLTWAFTRGDCHEPDRLVYEAFASEQLDNSWFVQRRRKPGPVSFNSTSLGERHALMLTATALSGGEELRSSLCRRPDTWVDDLAMVHDHLSAADQRELERRQVFWKSGRPERSQMANNPTVKGKVDRNSASRLD